MAGSAIFCRIERARCSQKRAINFTSRGNLIRETRNDLLNDQIERETEDSPIPLILLADGTRNARVSGPLHARISPLDVSRTLGAKFWLEILPGRLVIPLES